MHKTSVYTLVNGNIKELAHQKQQKPQKAWYCPRHTDCVSMYCWIRSVIIWQLIVSGGENELKMEEVLIIKVSWPSTWPWSRSYGTPVCSTHWRLPTYRISFKWKKSFLWTDRQTKTRQSRPQKPTVTTSVQLCI